jgi:hypothetical protein
MSGEDPRFTAFNYGLMMIDKQIDRYKQFSKSLESSYIIEYTPRSKAVATSCVLAASFWKGTLYALHSPDVQILYKVDTFSHSADN